MNNADLPAMPVTDEMGMPFNEVPSEACTIGLTKREYFAGLAMQAVISNPSFEQWASRKAETPSEYVARQSLQVSDALLAELEKQS